MKKVYFLTCVFIGSISFSYAAKFPSTSYIVPEDKEDLFYDYTTDPDGLLGDAYGSSLENIAIGVLADVPGSAYCAYCGPETGFTTSQGGDPDLSKMGAYLDCLNSMAGDAGVDDQGTAGTICYCPVFDAGEYCPVHNNQNTQLGQVWIKAPLPIGNALVPLCLFSFAYAAFRFRRKKSA